MAKRVQLVVAHLGHITRYYQITAGQGWRIDAEMRCIVIGKFPRTLIPLDNVLSFDVEEVGTDG